jgi:hypothetical protein
LGEKGGERIEPGEGVVETMFGIEDRGLSYNRGMDVEVIPKLSYEQFRELPDDGQALRAEGAHESGS